MVIIEQKDVSHQIRNLPQLFVKYVKARAMKREGSIPANTKWYWNWLFCSQLIHHWDLYSLSLAHPSQTPHLKSFLYLTKQQATELLNSVAPKVISASQIIFRWQTDPFVDFFTSSILTVAYIIYIMFLDFSTCLTIFPWPCQVHIITVWCITLSSFIYFHCTLAQIYYICWFQKKASHICSRK